MQGAVILWEAWPLKLMTQPYSIAQPWMSPLPVWLSWAEPSPLS